MYSYEMNYFIAIAFSQSKAEGGGQYNRADGGMKASVTSASQVVHHGMGCNCL